MTQDLVSILITLFVVLLVMTPFVIGAHLMAPKLGENRWVWTVLAAIPGVNALFGVYVIFCLVFHVVDSLNAIRTGLAPFAEPPASSDAG
jgi:hypothetical protein